MSIEVEPATTARFDGVATMIGLSTLVPHGALGQFVESIWMFRGSGQSAGTELVLPTGDLDLVIDVGQYRTVVSGPSTQPFLLNTDTSERVIVGVVLRIGGAAAVLGVPPAELRDLRVPLDDLWGPADVEELLEKSSAAAMGQSKVRAVERVLAGRLSHSWEGPHPCVGLAARELSHHPQRWRIAELSEAVGLSTRRLEQVFKSEVGLTPKEYQRLHRFRHALSGIDRAQEIGFAAYAAETGYYDQAHFSTEFRAHAGLSPLEYRRARPIEQNHVPIPA